jgi:hypothetical protein
MMNQLHVAVTKCPIEWFSVGEVFFKDFQTFCEAQLEIDRFLLGTWAAQHAIYSCSMILTGFWDSFKQSWLRQSVLLIYEFLDIHILNDLKMRLTKFDLIFYRILLKYWTRSKKTLYLILSRFQVLQMDCRS